MMFLLRHWPRILLAIALSACTVLSCHTVRAASAVRAPRNVTTLDTAADLAALDWRGVASDGQATVILRGWDSPGDGRGGLFALAPTNTVLPTNSIDTLPARAGGSVTGRWWRMSEGNRKARTISELEWIVPAYDGEEVEVQGLLSYGDLKGGPWRFVYRSGSTGATNGLCRLTATGVGRWTNEFWNGDAQIFGAIPGTECSLAISNALRHRNDVVLGYGTYYVKYPIEVGKQKTLRGSSPGHFNRSVLQATADHVGPAILVTYDQYPVVKDLFVYGNNTVKATLDGVLRYKPGAENEINALFENLMFMSLHTAISLGEEGRSGGSAKANIGRLVNISAYDLTGNGVELAAQDYLHYVAIMGELGSFASRPWPYIQGTNDTYGVLFCGNGATAQGGTMWGFKYGFGGGVYPRFNTHVSGWVEYCSYLANQPGGGIIYGTVHAPTTRFNANDKGRWVTYNQSPSAPYYPGRYPSVKDHLKASLFFNEGAGNFSVDRSGNGNHATWPANAGYWVKGGPFGAYFRRTNSFLSLPAATVPGNSNVTAIVLARADPAAVGVRPQLWRQIFDSNDFRAIGMVPESPLALTITAYGAGGSDSKGVFLGEHYYNSSNEFAHYMAAWDAGVNSNYVRGVFFDERWTNKTVSGSNFGMNLGVIPSGNCWIDIAHVAIFDKALEAAEVHDYLAWIYGATKFREPFDDHFSGLVTATNGQVLIPNAPITRVRAASTSGATLNLASGTVDGQRWAIIGASDNQVAVLPAGLANFQAGRSVRLLTGVMVSLVWDTALGKWVIVSEGGTPAASSKTVSVAERYGLAAGHTLMDPAGDGNMGTNWTQFLGGWSYLGNAWRFNSGDPTNNYAAITSPGIPGLRPGGRYRVELQLASPAVITGNADVQVKLGNETFGYLHHGGTSWVWESARCGSLSLALQVQCTPGSGSIDITVDSVAVRIWSEGDVFGSATIPANALSSVSDRFAFNAFGDALSTTNAKSLALAFGNASTNPPIILDRWQLASTSSVPWMVGANLYYIATNQAYFMVTGGGTNRMGVITLPGGASWSEETYLGVLGIQSVTNGILRLQGIDADLGFRSLAPSP